MKALPSCFIVLIALLINQAILASSLELTQTQHSQSLNNSWQLTEREQQRYEQLMQQQAGTWYGQAALSPVDILGLFAETEAKRDRYAEIAAKLHHKKVTQELAYNQAVQSAFERLYPELQPIQPFDMARFGSQIDIGLEGRWMLLVSPLTMIAPKKLEPILKQLQSASHPGLDIYFLHSDVAAIQRWASLHRLPRTLVDTGVITLNFAGSDLESIGKSGLPQWYEATSSGLKPLAVSTNS